MTPEEVIAYRKQLIVRLIALADSEDMRMLARELSPEPTSPKSEWGSIPAQEQKAYVDGLEKRMMADGLELCLIVLRNKDASQLSIQSLWGDTLLDRTVRIGILQHMLMAEQAEVQTEILKYRLSEASGTQNKELLKLLQLSSALLTSNEG